jgi:hypothetical protein
MANQQIIKVIQKGPKIEIEVEISSPNGGDGLYIPGVELYETRKVRTTGGAGFRIMKGVYVGGAQSRSQDEMAKVDKGYLEVNHKGIMFAGQSNTIMIDAKQIIRYQPYSDGIGIYKQGRQKEFRFVWGREACMQLVNVPDDDGSVKIMTGTILRQLIQAYARGYCN